MTNQADFGRIPVAGGTAGSSYLAADQFNRTPVGRAARTSSSTGVRQGVRAMSQSNDLQLTGSGAAYIRVSTDQQDTVRQHQAIHSFEHRYGITITKDRWYEDQGWARDTADERPDFQRMIKDAERGPSAVDRRGSDRPVRNERTTPPHLLHPPVAGMRLSAVRCQRM